MIAVQLSSLPSATRKCRWGNFPKHSKGGRTLSTLISYDTGRQPNEISLISHVSGFQFYHFLENEVIAIMGHLSAEGPWSSQEVFLRLFAMGYLWTDSSLGCILLHSLKYPSWQFCKPRQVCFFSRVVLVSESTICARLDCSLIVVQYLNISIYWHLSE